MQNAVFERFAEYYDLLYGDKDYAAEADYVGQTLRAANPGIQRLLEFGSGTGRHGRLLAQRGFQIRGIERSEAMVAAARTSNGGSGFESEVGDIRSTRVQGRFDAVISLFHVVSYLTSNKDLRATFANAAYHLEPGGLFLFDVWHGPAVLTQKPSVRVKRVENERVRLTRFAEPDLDSERNIVEVFYTILAETKASGSLSTFTERHTIRYLFPTEIEGLAADAGFEISRGEEFLTGTLPSTSTWGVAYLLRKLVS